MTFVDGVVASILPTFADPQIREDIELSDDAFYDLCMFIHQQFHKSCEGERNL